MHSTWFPLSCLQVAVTVFLAIVPFTFAISSPSRTSHSPQELHFRDTAVLQRAVLPTGWSSMGCFTYNPSAPALTSGGYTNSTSMTADSCVAFCHHYYYAYAGLENGTNCYCGNVLTPGVAPASNANCGTKCVGDSTETCGGNGFLNLYGNGGPLQPQPTPVHTVPSAPSWELLGCFNDSNTARALEVQIAVRGGVYNNTVGNCIDACVSVNYRNAGLEFAQECWCSHTFHNDTAEIDMSQCQLACSGDSTELCGGAHAYLLYTNTK
ncbi:WSC domain-containing protein [Lactarius quietus]|nr:WSC domain-containing protein [Lactarius quietus]